jgi:hypothetical protein
LEVGEAVQFLDSMRQPAPGVLSESGKYRQESNAACQFPAFDAGTGKSNHRYFIHPTMGVSPGKHAVIVRDNAFYDGKDAAALLQSRNSMSEHARDARRDLTGVRVGDRVRVQMKLLSDVNSLSTSVCKVFATDSDTSFADAASTLILRSAKALAVDGEVSAVGTDTLGMAMTSNNKSNAGTTHP